MVRYISSLPTDLERFVKREGEGNTLFLDYTTVGGECMVADWSGIRNFADPSYNTLYWDPEHSPTTGLFAQEEWPSSGFMH